ncbi:J domain-containing protein [Salinarimonas ramus]|uniref:Molecular chaperone DnaJ n=1 Tax=Salinarimonas ramus TaxID=690164 RepID=A0A917Q894_9HYPH|nr:J domain-containing protein [Salinarimonas ramus]GGK35441.1 molecular chaperone DnaJ [Salinarimonas ramus]
MDLNSPLFDRIRIKPKAEKAADDAKTSQSPACEHPGCTGQGLYRAPKGRGQEGKYWRFCMDHVRAYNASYNYFKDMPDDAVAAYQKESIIGHRPTWSMGVNPAARERAAKGARGAGYKRDWAYHDPFDVLREGGVGETRRAPEPPRPRYSGPVRQALDVLGLEEGADPATIKAAYKALVKKFHPDAHGGDRSYEERLRDIIRAHDTLKTAGLC